MNKEKEIIKLLEECIAKDLWFEINNDNATLLGSYINKIEQENKHLKDNWNKLKKLLPKVSKQFKNQYQLFSANCCEHILEIMNYIEKGE